jgi:MOSC domain-containing protein YiiM
MSAHRMLGYARRSGKSAQASRKLEADVTPLLVSLNVGRPQRLEGAEPWTSGIYKSPVAGRISLASTNLAGDGQADLNVHGGHDKAVCVYSADHYPFWREELAVPASGPGWFGENFSVEGQVEKDVAVGDTYRIGTAVVQISQPRVPCWKLGRRWNRPDMPKLVVESGRTGWYLRVLETGDVECGDELTLVDRPFARWTIDAVNAVKHSGGGTARIEAARELANCHALAESWRAGFRNLVD